VQRFLRVFSELRVNTSANPSINSDKEANMKKLFIQLLVAGFVATGVGVAPASAELPTPEAALAAYDTAVSNYDSALAAYVDAGRPKGGFKAVKVAYKAVVKGHIKATNAIGVAFRKAVKAAKVARKAAVDAATTVEEKKAARTAYNEAVASLISTRESQMADLGSLPAVPSRNG
jgi:hypothetical protein